MLVGEERELGALRLRVGLGLLELARVVSSSYSCWRWSRSLSSPRFLSSFSSSFFAPFAFLSRYAYSATFRFFSSAWYCASSSFSDWSSASRFSMYVSISTIFAFRPSVSCMISSDWSRRSSASASPPPL